MHESDEAVAARAALPLKLHISALVSAFQHQDHILLDLLKQFADVRDLGGTSESTLQQCLRYTSMLLAAADTVRTAIKVEGTAGSDLTGTLVALAAQLVKGCCLAKDLTDAYTDCALLLWKVAQPLLDGVFGKNDREADTVVQLLRALHVAFDALDYEDCILR